MNLQERLRDGITFDYNTAEEAADRIDADEALMCEILEWLERYQTKRQDFTTFETSVDALRKRLEQSK